MKFIKGRWYKRKKERRYIKFINSGEGISGTPSIIGKEVIKSSGKYLSHCDALWHKSNIEREASYEEYSKFLPKGHPDLKLNIDSYEIF